jgi:hypothetical protein
LNWPISRSPRRSRRIRAPLAPGGDYDSAHFDQLTIDPASLRGAIVTPGQLTGMTALLADGLGIVVEDGERPYDPIRRG